MNAEELRCVNRSLHELGYSLLFDSLERPIRVEGQGDGILIVPTGVVGYARTALYYGKPVEDALADFGLTVADCPEIEPDRWFVISRHKESARLAVTIANWLGWEATLLSPAGS